MAVLRTLAAAVERREEIRLSRFYAIGAPLAAPAECTTFLAAHRESAATHHCYAWRCGQDYHSADDGEPGGTAGRPILNAIERQGYDRIIVLVIRWFGGIKLGAGGLARAYGGIAARLLSAAQSVPLIDYRALTIRLPHSAVGVLHHLAGRHGAVDLCEHWAPDVLHCELRLPADRCRDFSAALEQATCGAAAVLARPEAE